MTRPRGDLSDPDFEPTGEELQALAHRAFEGIAEKHARALEELHRQIDQDREQLLRGLRERVASER